MATFLALLILLAVLALVIIRPRGLGVAWPAGIGAILVIGLGLVPPHELLIVFGDTWDATLTLIALFLLSETLERNGVFTWAALHLARLAGGSGWRLYGMAVALTAITSALLANDGAVLMLTPVFAVLLQAIFPEMRHRFPILFATGFFADALSTIFVPSNLTNIIIADANHLTFVEVAAHMAVPTVVALVVGGCCFAVRFRRDLGIYYAAKTMGLPGEALRDIVLFWCGMGSLLFLIVGYLLGSIWHLPIALIAGMAAIFMLVMTRIRLAAQVRSILRAAPWSILVYALGMFVVIIAAFDTGALSLIVTPIRALAPLAHSQNTALGLSGILGIGAILAGLAGSVNNLPAALVGVLAMRGVSHASANYAVILGVDIGPKLTPYGSLATLLWLEQLRRKEITISWGHYLRENWWVTLLTLLAALLALFLVG